MDTAVAIRTLEATYKSSADAAAVETMILKLTEKVEPLSMLTVLLRTDYRLTLNLNIFFLSPPPLPIFSFPVILTSFLYFSVHC